MNTLEIYMEEDLDEVPSSMLAGEVEYLEVNKNDDFMDCYITLDRESRYALEYLDDAVSVSCGILYAIEDGERDLELLSDLFGDADEYFSAYCQYTEAIFRFFGEDEISEYVVMDYEDQQASYSRVFKEAVTSYTNILKQQQK